MKIENVILYILAPVAFVLGLYWIVFESILYNPLWLFTKYRKLRMYVWAQAMHESNYLKDYKAREGNSILGMKRPCVRPSTAIATIGNNYAAYRSKGSALKDLFLWMDYNSFPKDVPDLAAYVKALYDRGYFLDTPDNYYNGLKAALNK